MNVFFYSSTSLQLHVRLDSTFEKFPVNSLSYLLFAFSVISSTVLVFYDHHVSIYFVFLSSQYCRSPQIIFERCALISSSFIGLLLVGNCSSPLDISAIYARCADRCPNALPAHTTSSTALIIEVVNRRLHRCEHFGASCNVTLLVKLLCLSAVENRKESTTQVCTRMQKFFNLWRVVLTFTFSTFSFQPHLTNTLLPYGCKCLLSLREQISNQCICIAHLYAERRVNMLKSLMTAVYV